MDHIRNLRLRRLNPNRFILVDPATDLESIRFSGEKGGYSSKTANNCN